MRDVVDTHAPLLRKEITIRPYTKWYSRDLPCKAREKKS